MATPPPRTGIVIFSGGSATNSLVDIFESVRASNHASISYVIPISDNGGSSSEIIRVFGGPGIGDVRSRLIRLVPEHPLNSSSNSISHPEPESSAVKRLLNHRLPADSYPAARAEWFDLVEGTHALWEGVSSPKRELVRSFLNCFNQEALKRTRPTSRFDFSGASVGNLFLTGARLFTGSFEAAIYLFGEVCGVPDGAAVLPALNTNFAHHIAAGLEDGSVIVGQNDISHPSIPSAAVPLPTGTNTPAPSSHRGDDDDDEPDTHEDEDEHIEDANLPGSLPALRRPAIRFTKDQEEDLPSRISRIWYINPYGQEIRLPANPRVLAALSAAHAAIYSIGSLYTSLIPSLILRGVGDAITSHCQHKILILNGSVDRETSAAGGLPFTALDFVAAVADACAQSRGMRPGAVAREEFAQYVTHVVYLEGERVPVVDRRLFAQLGIETTRVYGPRDERGGITYDGKALAQTLESIIGRLRGERSRRNTVVG